MTLEWKAYGHLVSEGGCSVYLTTSLQTVLAETIAARDLGERRIE
jgi:hypothetical protein